VLGATPRKKGQNPTKNKGTNPKRISPKKTKTSHKRDKIIATSDSWLVNTSASNYITHNQDVFVTYLINNLYRIKTLARLIYPKRRRTVIVNTKRTNKSTVTLKLKDVFYILDILFNLFSRTAI